MILTKARIICLNNKNSAFKTFDLPLALHLMKVLINLFF